MKQEKCRIIKSVPISQIRLVYVYCDKSIYSLW